MERRAGGRRSQPVHGGGSGRDEPRSAALGVLGQAAVDRERLLRAIGELGRERSWSTLSVARICARAKVPRRAFNLSFGSVEECYVAAVDAALQRLWTAVEATRAEADAAWAAQVGAAIVGFLRFVDDEPAAAWMCLVAPLGGSDRAREARQQTMERFAELIQGEAAAEREPTAPDRAARLSIGAVGGLWELARQHVSDPRAGLAIGEIAGSTAFLALAPHLPRETAMREAAAVAAMLEAVPPGDAVLADGAEPAAPDGAEARGLQAA